MILERLIQQISVQEFEASFFLKVLYSEPHSAQFLMPFGDLQALDNLFANPNTDLICGKVDGTQLDSKLARQQQPREVLAAGYTIGFRHAERADLNLTQVAESFRQDFLCDVDLHLYCTPANQAGFGWHYDAEDVFIVQTHGSKEWSFRKNSVNPWPTLETLPQNMRYEREIMPLYRCTLQAGDWLYIPHGYWHKTESKELSISLSIGLDSPSGLTLYDYVRDQLLDSLRWRQRLPAVISKDSHALEQEIAAHLATLGEDLQKLISDPKFVQGYLQARRARSHRIMP